MFMYKNTSFSFYMFYLKQDITPESNNIDKNYAQF